MEKISLLLLQEQKIFIFTLFFPVHVNKYVNV